LRHRSTVSDILKSIEIQTGMESKRILLKVVGAVVFICGGLIGGAVNVPGTWVSKLPALLGVAIAIFVCSIGVSVWRASNGIKAEDKESNTLDQNR
jgi:hypothetical protein